MTNENQSFQERLRSPAVPAEYPPLPEIKDMSNSPQQLNLNDRAMWVIGWNECRDQMRAHYDLGRAARAQAPDAVAWMEVEDGEVVDIEAHYPINLPDGEHQLYAAPTTPAEPALNYAPSAFVNGAGIKVDDKPMTVVRKLDSRYHDKVTFADEASPADALETEHRWGCRANAFGVCTCGADARQAQANADALDAEKPFLQEMDQQLLHRFIETSEDDESYDISKDEVKRLANIGVLESCGFGRYGVTMFGYWVHERFWHQNPSLPLKTNTDRDSEKRAALAAQAAQQPKGGA